MTIDFILLSAFFTLLSGIVHGVGEAEDKDPGLFEKMWGVDEVSFWGSKRDLLKYIENDSSKGYKSLIWKYYPFDFEHVQEWAYAAFLVAATAIGTVRLTGWGIILSTTLIYAGRALVALLVYEYLNKKK